MKEGKEALLTQIELNEIEDIAVNNQQFRDPFLFTIGTKHTDIIKMSQHNGLIFIKGNRDTGFEHIRLRHEQWIATPNWVKVPDAIDAKKTRLQDQSLFKKDSIPFFDYCLISDSIFNKQNINLQKNHRPDKFDLFIGNHINKDGATDIYHLLTYKGTKIVHTLFPKSNKNNPKRVKGFNLVKSQITSSINFNNLIQEIKIPYINQADVVRYVVIIRRIPNLKCENSYIQINNHNGTPWKTELIGTKQNNEIKVFNEIDLMRLEYSDFRPFERKILEFEKST